MKRTAVVIPCYNEASRLNEDAFFRVAREYSNLHFVFVNDGSTDQTQEKLIHVCAMNPSQFLCVALRANGGKAEAVRAGFLVAMDMKFDNIGYWDADLATPLEVAVQFADILESPNTFGVIGSRIRLLGRTIERSTARHYLGRAFATAASLALSLPVYDTQCGAKMFKNNETLKFVFLRPFSVKWTFDVEILARLLLIGRFGNGFSVRESIVEYPLQKWTDVAGSKVKPKDFLMGIVELGKVMWLLRGPSARRRFLGLTLASSKHNPDLSSY